VAQDLLVPYVSATTGVDAQSYRFGAGNPVRSIDQVAIPLGFVVPLGRRLSIDVGTSYAWTRVGLEDGTAPEIASLTDTQLRLAWLLGRDAAVLSLLVNLPTGAEQVTLGEFSAASAVATNFLPFPVHTYGTGAAVTAGAALAKPWGAWNVGLAGSLRLNGSYQPFANAPEEINYRQAIEGRVRVGVDRLVGSSRLSIGATVGTFGTDEFVNGSGTVVGEYRPGTRIMGEVSLASPLGSGAVETFLWGYRRSAGEDPQAGTLANEESIVALGAEGAWRLGGGLSLQPSLEGRWWAPARGSGWLAIAAAALPVRVSRVLSLVPRLRFELGSLERSDGLRSQIDGWGGSLFLRGSF
jgi:hypothetical protein